MFEVMLYLYVVVSLMAFFLLYLVYKRSYTSVFMLNKTVITLVKLTERYLYLKHPDIFPEHKRAFEPIDSWTYTSFFTSSVLGYLYPDQVPFSLSLILLIDIISYFLGEIESGEHMIMKGGFSITGFIIGSYLKTKKFL